MRPSVPILLHHTLVLMAAFSRYCFYPDESAKA